MARRLGRLGWFTLLALGPAAHAATLHPNLTDDGVYVTAHCGRDAPNQSNCTLAAAIAFAQPGDTVSLEPPSPPGPYTLSLGELRIGKDITIRGVGARSTTISTAGCPPPAYCRVFYVDRAAVTISRLTIADGKASLGGGVLVQGAAPNNPNAMLTLSDCTVRDSTSVEGGGIAVGFGRLVVIGSTITGNRARRAGGGIAAEYATVSISNSTLAGNTAGDDMSPGLGGGIYSIKAPALTIRSTTISGNTATGGGSAPRGGNLFGELGTTYDLENSIVANGIAGAGPNCTVPDTSSSFVSSGYNIDSLDECGFHAAGDHPNTDPHLLPLADNGGQTDTEALAADSPAIDAGSPDCPGADVDQRGVARPQPSGGRCDIGAFELVSTELCGDCLDNDRNGLTDLEDPACCRPAETLTLRASRLAPIHGGAKLKMGGALAPLTLQSGGATEDLFVQLRVEDQPDFLCARIPAANLARRGSRRTFKDRKHAVASAHGIDAVVLKQRKKVVVFTVGGTNLAVPLPAAGTLQATVGLRDPASSQSGDRCGTVAASLKKSRKGMIRFP